MHRRLAVLDQRRLDASPSDLPVICTAPAASAMRSDIEPGLSVMVIICVVSLNASISPVSVRSTLLTKVDGVAGLVQRHLGGAPPAPAPDRAR